MSNRVPFLTRGLFYRIVFGWIFEHLTWKESNVIHPITLQPIGSILLLDYGIIFWLRFNKFFKFMKNSSEEPIQNHERIDVKKIDKDTYQEKGNDTGDTINYKKTIQKFRFWLGKAEIERNFEVNCIGFDKNINDHIEKSLNRKLLIRGKVKDYWLDNLFVIESRSWSKEDVYYDSQETEEDKGLSIELIGCKDLADRNVFYGGFSNKSSLWCRIPSDFLEEVAVNLAKYPDYSIELSFMFVCFKSEQGKILIESALIEESSGIYIERIGLRKKVRTPKNTKDKSNELGDFKAEERNQNSLFKVNSSNVTSALWFIGGMLLANLFK